MASLYEQLLAKGKDAIAAIKLPFKVRKEKKNLEMKILEQEQQLATYELAIQEQKSKHPINWNVLIKAIDGKAINERKLKQLQDLETELFGENTEKA